MPEKRGDSKELRAKVFKRDNGVCEKCGLETERLIDIALEAGLKPSFLPGTEDEREIAAKYWVENFGFGGRVSLWDADHIIPVEEWPAGKPGLNALAQMQTLCCHCHPNKSADHAARRARRRKQRKKVGPKERHLRDIRGAES